jgi:hypothetical protein
MSFLTLSRDELSLIIYTLQQDTEDTHISYISLVSKDMSEKMKIIPFRKHIVWDGERTMQFIQQSHIHLRTVDKITIYDVDNPCIWITTDWPREVVFDGCYMGGKPIEATAGRGKNVKSITIINKSLIEINKHTFPHLIDSFMLKHYGIP